MGLLSHIEEAAYNKKTPASSLSFKDYQNKYSTDIFGVFTKKETDYVLTKAFGIDLKTIVNFKIESSFFDSLLIFEKKVYNYIKSDLSIQKLVECFSFDFKDIVKAIYLFKTNDSILMICNTDESTAFSKLDENFKDLSELIKSNSFSKKTDNETESNYYNYKVSFKTAISNSLKDYKYGTEFQECVYNQLLLNLSLYFPTPSYIIQNDDFGAEIHISAKNEISTNLLKTQLQNNFTNILGKSVEDIEVI